MEKANHRHFLLHKPYGYISQFSHNEKKRRNKKLLGDLHLFPEGTMAIGRLDKNSEGLLLLTTDGSVSHQIRSKDFEKEYYVELDGEITPTSLEMIRNGVKIRVKEEMYETWPCEVFGIKNPPFLPIEKKRHRPTSWISITLREGKFHQVRKMTAAIGFPTLRLVRVRVGNHLLGTLRAGEVREVDNLLI